MAFGHIIKHRRNQKDFEFSQNLISPLRGEFA
jgi:hypothetical protein